MNNIKINSSHKILNTMKELSGIKADKELAEAMGVKYDTLTKWIARSSIQYEPVIRFAVSRGIDLNQLFTDTINLGKLTIKTEQPNMLKKLETKYLFYKEHVGLRVVNKLDDDIQTLIEKYDDLVVLLENLMEQEGIK